MDATATLPSIPKELIDQFVAVPMSAEAVNVISIAFSRQERTRLSLRATRVCSAGERCRCRSGTTSFLAMLPLLVMHCIQTGHHDGKWVRGAALRFGEPLFDMLAD